MAVAAHTLSVLLRSGIRPASDCDRSSTFSTCSVSFPTDSEIACAYSVACGDSSPAMPLVSSSATPPIDGAYCAAGLCPVNVHWHLGAEHLSVWLPQPEGVQQRLVAEDPSAYFRPPYVGHRGWVAVVLDNDPDWSRVEQHVRDAYLHVAGKRLRERMLAEDL